MLPNDFNPFFEYLREKYGFINMIPYLLSHIGFNYFIGVESSSKKHIFVKMDGSAGEASEREACLIQLLRSQTQTEYFPNLVAYESEGPYPFVALEFIHGKSLDQFLVQSPLLSPLQKWELLQQIVEILTILHKTNVIHRDIRPANIMIRTGDAGQLQLILIDFAFSVGLTPNDLQELNFLLDHELLIGLGNGFKPGALTWDDAYSFCQIARLIICHSDGLLTEQCIRLTADVGKLIYTY